MDIERNGERLLLNETCLRVLLLNMADEDYLEVNHSDEEEYDEDYARSEHGETTEAENEIVFYWERLRRGVMSHPVRLQVQCLLYIIGHISFDADAIGVDSQTGLPLTGISIYINNARRYLPPNSLGLLPRFIRIKLLLLLPAVDVAMLEGTPVTSGISMNEIWETICKERLPLHKKKDIEREIGSTIGTLEDLREEGVESVSWKEAYFNIVFLFSQLFYNHMMSLEDDECGCVYNHFLPDLFYSMDTFYSDPFSSELYQCFNEESSLSIHEVYRCAHKCPRLTPQRYYNMYPDPSSPRRRECEYNISLVEVVHELADCNVSLKHLHMSGVHFKEISSCLDDVDFIDCFSKLLTSVEAITVHLCYLKEDKFQQSMKKIFDIIFVQKKCPIRYVNVPDEDFKVIYPFLMESPHCNLKQFELTIEETSQETFAGNDLPQLANPQDVLTPIFPFVSAPQVEGLSAPTPPLPGGGLSILATPALPPLGGGLSALNPPLLSAGPGLSALPPLGEKISAPNPPLLSAGPGLSALPPLGEKISAPNPSLLSAGPGLSALPPLGEKISAPNPPLLSAGPGLSALPPLGEKISAPNPPLLSAGPGLSALPPLGEKISAPNPPLLSAGAGLSASTPPSLGGGLSILSTPALDVEFFPSPPLGVGLAVSSPHLGEGLSYTPNVSQGLTASPVSAALAEGPIVGELGAAAPAFGAPQISASVIPASSQLSTPITSQDAAFNLSLGAAAVGGIPSLATPSMMGSSLFSGTALGTGFASNYSRKVQESSPVMIDESLSRSIINVLQHHQGLQKFSLCIDFTKDNELKLDAELIECMSDLLLRPVFKELVFGNFRYQKPVSPDIVLCLFRKFFSSPCPVSMTLNDLNCPEFPVNTDPFTINHDQAAGKSLQMDDCTFSPNFLSLLPRSLVLKSLTIDDYHLKILPSFAELELITVNSFSLRCGCHQGNLAIISSLFHVVNAQQWSLSLSLSDEILEEFISLLSKVSHLLCQFEITNWSIPFDNLISMIETIFISLSPANLSQFELSLHNHLFSDDVANALYKSWEKCGAVKLKKITILDRREYGKLAFMSILLDMANEVYVEKNR